MELVELSIEKIIFLDKKKTSNSFISGESWHNLWKKIECLRQNILKNLEFYKYIFPLSVYSCAGRQSSL